MCSYLLQLILDGKVQGIIAGPPCTTFSRARASQPGLRVLRSRAGIERFGLASLTSTEQAQVFGDNALIVQMLFLMHVAQEVRKQQAFIAIEHPRDPKDLDPERAQNMPTLWEWPELASLGLCKARFDQGLLGHRDVKPTMLATSSWELFESLEGRLLRPEQRWVSDVDVQGSLEGRIAHVRKASGWAPGLVQAIRQAWANWGSGNLDGQNGLRRLEVLASLLRERGLSLDALDELLKVAVARAPEAPLTKKEQGFKDRIQRGHLPWRRDCRACLQAAAFHHPCRRQKHPHCFSLSMDLTGPYKVGSDQSGLCRYGVVGVYSFPLFWRNGNPVEVPEGRFPRILYWMMMSRMFPRSHVQKI